MNHMRRHSHLVEYVLPADASEADFKAAEAEINREAGNLPVEFIGDSREHVLFFKRPLT